MLREREVVCTWAALAVLWHRITYLVGARVLLCWPQLLISLQATWYWSLRLILPHALRWLLHWQVDVKRLTSILLLQLNHELMRSQLLCWPLKDTRLVEVVLCSVLIWVCRRSVSIGRD